MLFHTCQLYLIEKTSSFRLGLVDSNLMSIFIYKIKAGSSERAHFSLLLSRNETISLSLLIDWKW
jgi:hypothetical protein